MSSNEETKTETDADELGALAAELPVGADQAGAARDQDDGDEGIDRAALSALSKAPPQRSDPAASPSSARSSAATRWIGPLILGFAVGVPVGGWLFSGASAGPSANAETVRSEAHSGESSPVAALAASEAPSETIARIEPPAPAPAQPSTADPPAAAEPAPAEPTTARAPMAAVDPAARPNAPASAVPAPVVAIAANPATPRAQAAGTKPQPTAAVSQPNDKQAAAVAPPSPQPRAAATPAPAPAVPAAAPSSDARSVDTLLDQALSQRKAAPPPMVLTADETVPLAPSREEVKRAMTVLLPAIRGCATGQSGLATIGIVVNNDGKVASADVTGAPFEGAPSGRCIAGVVRRAKFPRFQQESFRVQFPFQIQ